MIATLKRMPFAKHNPSEKVVHTNNVFTKGAINYRKLAEGFWIIVSEIEFKKNVCVKTVYDKEPCDHYFLTHFNYSNIYQDDLPADARVRVTGWSLYKPGTLIKRYFNKGDQGTFLNFAFNTAWYSSNVPIKDIADERIINQYLSYEKGFITWDELVPGVELLIGNIVNVIKLESDMPFNNLSLTMYCLEAITVFFKSIASPQKVKSQLNEADNRMIEQAEKILLNNLISEFPGIEAIAGALHTSQTKLKTSFKIVHNTSMYQFYREKQMDMALELLKAKPTSLKEIAHTFGYDNPSKFAAAFKKRHNFPQSDI